jgi:hypothetical protein
MRHYQHVNIFKISVSNVRRTTKDPNKVDILRAGVLINRHTCNTSTQSATIRPRFVYNQHTISQQLSTHI